MVNGNKTSVWKKLCICYLSKKVVTLGHALSTKIGSQKTNYILLNVFIACFVSKTREGSRHLGFSDKIADSLSFLVFQFLLRLVKSDIIKILEARRQRRRGEMYSRHSWKKLDNKFRIISPNKHCQIYRHKFYSYFWISMTWRFTIFGITTVCRSVINVMYEHYKLQESNGIICENP